MLNELFLLRDVHFKTEHNFCEMCDFSVLKKVYGTSRMKKTIDERGRNMNGDH